MDIRQDPKVEYFLKSERKQSTIKKYIRDINYFAESVGKTPTELIQEARYEQKNFDWMDERQLPHYFDKYH